MHIVRAGEAPAYDSPGHHGMQMRRLQGREAGPAQALWLGLSVIEPGGGTTLQASDVEKFYVVLEGSVEMTGSRGDTVTQSVLSPLDSCRFAAGEARQLFNPGPGPAKVLLAMPLPPGPAARS